MPQAEWERDLDQWTARINPDTGEMYSTTSWASVDLEPYKRGEQVIAPPLFLHREDGKALIYPGRPHVFFGESESLKSWAALMACKSVVVAGFRAVYVDLEGSEPSFVERAKLVGIPDNLIGDTLHYVRPTEALEGDARVDFWHHEMEMFEPTLVVLDGVTELYSLQDWNIDKATDAVKFQKTFAFHRGGIASIAIDHTAKDAGRGALGSQHKRAGLDGAEFLFESITRGGRSGVSVARVRISKDRHGFIRQWAGDVVGKLIVAPDGVTIEPPKLSDLINTKSDAQDRVREFLSENPGSSGRQIIDGTGMKSERAREALSGLELLGEARNTGTASRGSWELTEDV